MVQTLLPLRIAVRNSASVERLFSAFGNIQTKRRSRFVHARVQKLATIESMLPVKPRPKKKLAGNQYLGGRTLRSVTLDKETATAEATQAKAETERQFMDDSSDLLLDVGQVDVIIQEYQQQIDDDAEDDDDYEHIPAADRCTLEGLSVDMPPFDLNMLFEDEVAP
ncbi:TPA: hypothetical protein ACH3X1_016001 [Trebouxia sp. C0004]